MTEEEPIVSGARRNADRIQDEYLVVCIQNGDRRAFEDLARRWSGRLAAHATRLTGDPDLARDVAQDAWADIARGVRRLVDPAAFPAWAYRIVSRRAADAIRGNQRRRRTARDFAQETKGAVAPAPADPATLTITHAIARLPTDQQVALGLYYGGDLSVAEIARLVGAPAGTVKSRLFAAREALKVLTEGESHDRSRPTHRGSAEGGGSCDP